MATTRPAAPTPQDTPDSGEGLGQGIYISCDQQDVDTLIDTFEHWFADRDDITLVGSGSSRKLDQGFVILEWDGPVERSIISWLRRQEIVTDFSLYMAFHGQEDLA
jgi:hypothetical protein